MGRAANSIEGLSKKVEGVGSTLRRQAGAIAAAVSVTEVYQWGAAFEQATHQAGAALDLTSGQLAQFQDKILAGAGTWAQYGYSVADASHAFLELGKAGMSGQQAMDALNATLVLARAGGMATADAAGFLSDTLNVWKLEATKAADVTNVLANAANISSINIEDLAYSFSQTSAVAAQAGLSVEDTAAAIAQLGMAGIKGSDAGTSLKTMLMRLSAPTGEAQREFDKLGVSIFDAQGTMKPFRQIIAELGPALGALSQEQRAAAMNTIFGSDAIRAANTILLQGATEWDKYRNGVAKAGAAQALANANSAGLSGTLSQLWARLQSAATIVYMKVAPALDALIKGLMGATEFIAQNWNIVGPILAGIAGILATVYIPALITAATATLVNGARMAAGWVLALGPVGWAIGLIVALAAAIALNWDKAKEWTGKLWSALTSFFDWLGGALSRGWDAVVSWASSLPARIGAELGRLAAAGADAARRLGDALLAGLKAIPGLLVDALKLGLRGVGVLLGALVYAVTQLPGQIVQGLSSLGSLLWSLLTTAFTRGVEIVANAGQLLLTWAAALPGRILTGLSTLGTQLATFFSAAWQTGVDTVVLVGSAVVEFAAALPGLILDGVAALPGMLLGFFGQLWTDAVAVVRDGVGWVVDQVAQAPGRLLAFGGALLDAGRSLIDSFFSGLKSVGGWASDVGAAIIRAVKSGLNWVIDQINSGIGWIDNVLPGDLPRLPHLAMGGYSSGGVYTVGERGPETVYLPRGAYVQPHAAGGGAAAPVITVNVATNADPFEISRAIAWQMRTGMAR
ncbi:hypothetical protein GCM10012275_19230 [Longimycelium tulufanense]|uniref:Phage tail tape measure protein domain-containing protein n=1 Tax=Longimycelium tulufanense TaxID=907463 RepID=A0A8J3CD29_9PSEU|nr:phage tail tape measure protein [Longimycelium tulufanense]GGM48410.1 hypothetical protein GCM10012275_19230 [Longimycelium tulufanense]